MSTPKGRNIPASIRQRLLNLARTQREVYFLR